MNEGWIKLYRNLREHWIYSNADYLKAWVTLLMLCNHKEEKVLLKGQLITCGRGQSLKSLDTWVKEFGRGWTMQRVRTFFNLLERDKMITLENIKVSTRLSICNYDEYQDSQQANNKQVTSNQQADNTPVTTNKNEKKDKNEKNKGEGTDGLATDVSNPPLVEVYILPENLKLDYLAVMRYVLGAAQLSKLKSIEPQNYEKLREAFTHEQIMNTLAEMENTKGLATKYSSIHLTALNWLKRDHGKPENIKLAEDMEAVYRKFIKEKSGMEPNIDKYERTALNNLADFLTKNSTLKNSEGAMLSWNYILLNWGKLDSFMQNRIKLAEIGKDINKILKIQRDAANNGHNSTKATKEDTGGKKTFD